MLVLFLVFVPEDHQLEKFIRFDLKQTHKKHSDTSLDQKFSFGRPILYQELKYKVLAI